MPPNAFSVSVIICNFNYEKFLDQAVQSALAQTHPAKEVIVVDDGSTDGSWDLLQHYQGQVQLIRKENGGQISAYNAGLPHITADFVIFLDSDDFLDRDCIEVLSQRLRDDIVKAHWRMRLVDGDGHETGARIPTLLFDGKADHARLSKGIMPPSSPGSGNVYNVGMLRSVMPLPVDEVDRHGADFFAIRAMTWLGTVLAIEDRELGCYRIDASKEASSLVFGNAAKRKAYTYQSRIDRFKRWFSERRPELANLVPAVDIDFSIQKQSYALSIFSGEGYWKGLSAGSTLWPDLIRAIWYREGGGVAKIALTMWSAFVLLAPRRLGLPVAGYVCNPARRV